VRYFKLLDKPEFVGAAIMSSAYWYKKRTPENPVCAFFTSEQLMF
jgi:hypothetical protein